MTIRQEAMRDLFAYGWTFSAIAKLFAVSAAYVERVIRYAMR